MLVVLALCRRINLVGRFVRINARTPLLSDSSHRLRLWLKLMLSAPLVFQHLLGTGIHFGLLRRSLGPLLPRSSLSSTSALPPAGRLLKGIRPTTGAKPLLLSSTTAQSLSAYHPTKQNKAGIPLLFSYPLMFSECRFGRRRSRSRSSTSRPRLLTSRAYFTTLNSPRRGRRSSDVPTVLVGGRWSGRVSVGDSGRCGRGTGRYHLRRNSVSLLPHVF